MIVEAGKTDAPAVSIIDCSSLLWSTVSRDHWQSEPAAKKYQCPLLKSMDTLPIELVSRIFLLESANLLPEALSRHRLTISAVCSSWRATALTTQYIWSFIDVVLRSTTSIENVMSLLNLYLERAYSVSIDIIFFANALPTMRSKIVRVWETISKHLHRCRSLRIVGDIEPEIFLPFRTSMNRLESLEIAQRPPVGSTFNIC